MSGAVIVAGYTLREALRRRVLAVVLVLTALFGALYAFACSELFAHVSGFNFNRGIDERTLGGSTILGLAMFGSLFLGTVLAVFLTASAVRGDSERGLLAPVVVRPLSRTAYLGGRLLAAASVAAAYVVITYLLAVLCTGAIGHWWPSSIPGSALRLGLAAVVVTSLTLLGSVFFTATANGIVVLMLYGFGILAGLLGEIGDVLPSATLQKIANIASWALPFEALYRDALRLLVGGVPGIAGAIVRLGPLGGSHAAGPLLIPWTVGYIVVVVLIASWALARRDL
jgi:Cu-processing system permease protein